MQVNKPTHSEISAWLRDNPTARDFGNAYITLYDAIRNKWPDLVQDDPDQDVPYDDDAADDAIARFLWWWRYGN